MEEEVFSAFGGVGDGFLFVAVAVMIVGGVAGDQSSFKGGQGFANVGEVIWSCVAREGLREEAAIDGVGGQDFEEWVVLLVETQFDGVVVEERGYRLVFELGDGGVRPVEDSEPGDIGQRHGAAGMGLAGDSDGYGALVGESVLLHVAGGTGAFAVGGQSEVVKEVAAQLNFGCGHWVIGWDWRRMKAGWEMPVEGVIGFEGQGGDSEEEGKQEGGFSHTWGRFCAVRFSTVLRVRISSILAWGWHGILVAWDTLLLMKMDSAKRGAAFRWIRLGVLGLLLMAAGGVGAASAAGQDAAAGQAAPAVLKVEGTPTPLALTAEDLAKMPRTTATLTADGTTTTYEGVLLYDILVKAGWQFGRGMTGKGMASYLIATGKDGYQVVFALPEIDPMFAGAKVIIADKADGTALPGRELPFRVVAPQDKMHARSIYSLVKLEVVRLRQ